MPNWKIARLNGTYYTVLRTIAKGHGMITMTRKDSRENLAQTAIAYLIAQAVQNQEYEETLIRHALSYSRRHRSPIPGELRRKFCAKCRHIYSQSAVRRIKGSTLLIHCDKCGSIRRVKLPKNNQ